MSEPTTEGVDVPWPADDGGKPEEWQAPRANPLETPEETLARLQRASDRMADAVKAAKGMVGSAKPAHPEPRAALDPVRAWALRAAVELAAAPPKSGLDWTLDAMTRFEQRLRGEK